MICWCNVGNICNARKVLTGGVWGSGFQSAQNGQLHWDGIDWARALERKVLSFGKLPTTLVNKVLSEASAPLILIYNFTCFKQRWLWKRESESEREIGLKWTSPGFQFYLLLTNVVIRESEREREKDCFKLYLSLIWIFILSSLVNLMAIDSKEIRNCSNNRDHFFINN